MPQIILGVDVGSYSVKVAEIVRSFNHFELRHFYERPIPYNDVLTPEESTTSALTGLVEEHGLHWDSLITAIPGQHVACREVFLPFGPKKVGQTIEFELENFLPFPIDEVSYDYYIVRGDKSSSEMLVAYVTKAELGKFLSTMQGGGMDPRRVGVEGAELVSLMHIGMVPPEGSYAMVDIGHSKTTLTICRGKQLAFMRTILIGGKHYTEAIANALHVPMDEAEKLKIEIGQLPVEGEEPILDDISKTVVKVMQELTNELVLQIRQTFFAHQDKNEEVVSGLYLSGGTSRIRGIDRYLSHRLKLNAIFLNCFDFHFCKIGQSDAHPQVVPMAMAIALRGVAPAGLPDLNFRKGDFAYKGNVQQLGGGIRRAVAALIVILVLAISYYALRSYTLNSSVDQLTKEIKQLVKQAIPTADDKSISNPSAALRFVKGKQNEVGERLQKLSGLLDRNVLNVLLEISSKLPPRNELSLNVDDMNFMDDGKIKLKGYTDSQESFNKIRDALMQSGLFRNVIGSAGPGTIKDTVAFDISFELKPTDGEAPEASSKENAPRR
ncbi:MAG: hypothetical protein COV45_08575 [Deltaproteobacteria bacterium CG11_big_fil_rev_8_21_14_0_20_47_16]|nr:MAG: hypothetical protein COV45_08575 [Deltaproteobacteria bacterium CG11_big_fil_rev_8_21_14_0_20_47_16]